MRYKMVSAVAAGMLLIATFVYAGSAPEAQAATSSPAAGVYSGPAYPSGVTEHDAFATWLNSPVPYAVEFLDYTRPWAEIADPSWALDRWAQWISAQQGRRLVLSVPMLVNGSAGQLSQGASGAFDSTFRTLAQNMVSRSLGSSVIRLGWEMNNSAFPWYAGADPVAFRSFYARVVTVMRSVPGAAFTFDWNANPGVQGGSTLTTFESFYPGDAYVDVIGLDVYDMKWMDSTSTPANRWSWMLSQKLGLNEHRAFAAAHGKPVSFPEWGLYRTGTEMGGGGDNPYFIDAMADWIASSNTSYQAFFDYDWGGGTIEMFPKSQAQYKVRFGATTTTPPLPLLTLTDVKLSVVTKDSAVITWVSSLPASSVVRYGVSVPTLSAIGVDALTVHTVVLTGLSPRTKYAYKVQSTTAQGLLAESTTAFFTTPKR